MRGPEYEIPDDIWHSNHSKAFEQFLFNWFENSFGLTRGDVDLDFLKDLTESELVSARQLLRTNLKLGYIHIINGLADLGDKQSIPTLQEMLDRETDLSRKLTIAGALWRLSSDASFPQLLAQMARSDNAIVKQAHFDQILWIGDERSVYFLFDLLEDNDSFVRYLAVSRLNEIEFETRFLVPEKELPHQQGFYSNRRNDESFIKIMVENLNRYTTRCSNH